MTREHIGKADPGSLPQGKVGDTAGNLLLSSLSVSTLNQITPFFRYVSLPARFILYGANAHVSYAYFLTSGLASLVYTSAAGVSAEVSMIGREGLVGSVHMLGPAVDVADCFMHVEGTGWRIRQSDLHQLFQRLPELRSRVLEYVQYYNLNLAQVACCNRLHDNEARIARWLLMARDRLQNDRLIITHELLSKLVGASRPAVSLVTADLQRRALIRNDRGKLTLLAPEQLRELACECLTSYQARAALLFKAPTLLDTAE